MLLRSETNDPSKSACFLLIMVGWRPTYAASSLDSATSENRQSAADMKYRHTLRNCAGDRRMIDTAYSSPLGSPVPADATAFPMANRPPSAVALSMRLNEIRWPWSSHTATFTIMLSCRAFAIAAATIVFASAKVRVTERISRCVSVLSRLNG